MARRGTTFPGVSSPFLLPFLSHAVHVSASAGKGIKVGSVEIENACNAVPGVRETAAVAVAGPGGGPSRLVVYAVPEEGADADEATLLVAMRQSVKTRLNPLFAVTDVVVKDALPRTASNKVMRRVLRDEYLEGD